MADPDDMPAPGRKTQTMTSEESRIDVWSLTDGDRLYHAQLRCLEQRWHFVLTDASYRRLAARPGSTISELQQFAERMRRGLAREGWWPADAPADR